MDIFVDNYIKELGNSVSCTKDIDPDIICSNNIDKSLDVFMSHEKPEITIKEYLSHLVCQNECSCECFIVAMIYINRLLEKHKYAKLDMCNIHRLLLVAFVIAIKNIEDIYFSNKHYAMIGGISKEELNDLELYFLKKINFDLHIDVNTFNKWNNKISRSL